MARTRMYDPVPQWTTSLGALAAGGSITFYNSGSTTPRSVWSASSGGSDLGNVLTIDSDGRLSEDFWLDGLGLYRAVLKDANGVTIWTRDEIG